MNKLVVRFSLVALLILVSACKPIWYKPPDTPEALWQLRSEKLATLTNWAIKGRTAITQGTEGWNAGISWSEQQGAFQINLTGPFAQGGVVLKGDKQQVVLTMAGGKKITSTTPETLLEEHLGVRMPVSALRDWVRGLPDAKQKVDTMELDIEGRITYLKQQDWEVEILRYVPFEEYFMPAKIFIKHPDVSLRLIIRDWDKAE
ncbi:outer membrane lipoprotein LolB [Methylophaga sp. 42_25_T18]|nr:outer membrane lipoprotein LolB [Methylophaga sp. 42_25_T18]OUR89656.1 outer membrane lipoprotein LolB [Methylophaga sp. 42_8_T64]